MVETEEERDSGFAENERVYEPENYERKRGRVRSADAADDRRNHVGTRERGRVKSVGT